MAASAKHRLGFREKLGLYALALLLIGAALLGYLWFALDRYESNTPESSVRRYLQETAAGQWETILRDAEADLSPLDRPEDYTAWLTEVYAGLPEEYTLVRTSGGEGQTYALMDGSREVSRRSAEHDGSPRLLRRADGAGRCAPWQNPCRRWRSWRRRAVRYR